MAHATPRPQNLPSNQFDHFYRGGNRIGELRGGPGGPMRPEEWIASTTTRFGQTETGLSKLEGQVLLKDAIESDPVSWLGQDHINSFGTSTEILVKLLDPDQRLPVHYHPNKKFAREKLSLNHGKTEAWIVLEAPANSKVGLGFNREMSKAEVAGLVAAHDSQSLLDSLEFFEVKAGDAVFVPAGVPHAIDAGILVLELQEPTDLSILLEWDGFAVDGDKDGHLSLGFETALDALKLDPLTDSEKSTLFSTFQPDSADAHAIFHSVANPFFRADYLPGHGEVVEAGFGIYLCLADSGEIQFENAGALEVKRGDAIVIPHCAGSFRTHGCSGIVCRPPVELGD